MIKMAKFALVGGVGFIADALCFYVMIEYVQLPPSAARIFSFLLAMVVTWLGNRYLTFTMANRNNALQQFMKHSLVASSSFILNFILFQSLLFLAMPIYFAFIAGTLLGMISNFFYSNKIVFTVS